MDPRTRFWIVILVGIVVTWIVGELLSLLLWTVMRERPTLAARLGWLVAIAGTAAVVNGMLHLYHSPPVLTGEGALLFLTAIVFVLTYRSRTT